MSDYNLLMNMLPKRLSDWLASHGAYIASSGMLSNGQRIIVARLIKNLKFAKAVEEIQADDRIHFKVIQAVITFDSRSWDLFLPASGTVLADETLDAADKYLDALVKEE